MITIRYKDKKREQIDIDKFRYKTGTILKANGYPIVEVYHYSQSPLDLSPAISCYVIKKLDGTNSPNLFRLCKNSLCMGEYYYRIPRRIIEQLFKPVK